MTPIVAVTASEGAQMAGITGRAFVTVWGRQYHLVVHQQSKSGWIARGDFNGTALEAKGRSASGAAAHWRQQAHWRNEAAIDPAAALRVRSA